jgi:hypothetical protein
MKINLSEITEYSTQSLKKALEQNASEYTEDELKIIKTEYEQRTDNNRVDILNESDVSQPRLLVPFILLFILYASQTGSYLNISVPFEEANYLALIDIAFISFILMIIPFIARLYNKKPLSYEKGKSLCSLNSILLFIISICMQIVINFGFVGGIGALMYYYINMSLFCEKKPEKISTAKNTFFANPKLTDVENQRIFFSEMPLEELKDLIENKKEEYTEEAYNIALEQYKLRSTINNSIYSSQQYINTSDTENTFNSNDNPIAEKNNILDNVANSNFFAKNAKKICIISVLLLIISLSALFGSIGFYNSTSKKNNVQSTQATTSITYVGSKNSNKYHLPTCKWAENIKKSNKITFSSESKAKSKGYSPCKTCIN